MDYINSIMEKYPPFKTKEEEDEMINNYLKKNDVQGMRNELVLRNVGLIRKYSKPWNTLYTKDECASFGIEGLVRAANTFDPKVGVRFSTYAGFGIRTALRRKKETIRSRIDEKSLSMDYELKSTSKESISGIIDSKVRDEYRVIKPTSYYVGKKDTINFVFGLLKDIGCAEREISVFRKIIVDGTSLNSIAQEQHLSRERVRQIYEKTCIKLRINLGRVSKKILNRPTPNVKDFEQRKTYQVFKDGHVVDKSFSYGVDWDGYYDSVKYSYNNCFLKLREIIKDGIVS